MRINLIINDIVGDVHREVIVNVDGTQGELPSSVSQALKDALACVDQMVTDGEIEEAILKADAGAVHSDRIHNWFGLGYQSYLVLPRSILQSLPDDVQQQFVDALDEMAKHFKCFPYGDNQIPHTGEYQVMLVASGSDVSEHPASIHDPLRDYERGRRVVTIGELAWLCRADED